jgi:WD40 repeat protein
MADNPDQAQYEYDAFISYRHVPRDILIAAKLHNALETYRTPRYLVKRGLPARLKRVFRDREELPTSSDLGHDIENALKRSRFLIVLCSPEALQSKWVQKEVELFCGMHGYERVLAILVDGEPETAFPPGLIRRLYDEQGAETKVIEPLAADVRAKEKATPLQLLKVEKLRIIAGILGCRYDELRQREQERRVRRILAVSVSAGAFLLALTAFTLWQLSEVNAARALAVQNEQQALEAKANALTSEQNALEQQSNLYAALARQATDAGDRLLGMSLAMEALPKDLLNPEKPLTQEARDALYYAAALQGQRQATYLYPDKNGDVDGDYIRYFYTRDDRDAVYFDGDTLFYFDPATGRQTGKWSVGNDYMILDVSPDGSLAAAVKYVYKKGVDLQIWDVMNKAVLNDRLLDVGEFSQIEIDLNGFIFGDLIAAFDESGQSCYVGYRYEYSYYEPKYTSLTHTEPGEKNAISYNMKGLVMNSHSGLATYELPVAENISDNYINAEFSGDSILTLTTNGGISVYDTQQKRLLVSIPVEYDTLVDDSSPWPRLAAVNTDGNYLVYCGADKKINLVNLETLKTGSSKDIVDEMQISRDGQYIAYKMKVNNFLTVYDLLHNKAVAQPNCKADEFSFMGRYLQYDNNLLDLNEGSSLFLQNTDFSYDTMHDYSFSKDGASFLYLGVNKPAVSLVKLFDAGVKTTKLAYNARKTFDSQDKYIITGDQLKTGDVWLSILSRTDGHVITVDLGNIGWPVYHLSAGGSLLYACYSDIDNRMFFKAFDAGTGALKKTIEFTDPDMGEVTDFAFAPDGRHALVIGDGYKLVDLDTGKASMALETQWLYTDEPKPGMDTVGFFPGGKYCWSVIDSGEAETTGVRITEVDSGKTVSVIPLTINSHFENPSALLSPDGSRMVTYSYQGTLLWALDNAMNAKQICKLSGGMVYMDAARIVTDGGNIYDTGTGMLLAHLNTNSLVEKVIYTGGGVLALDGDGISLWDANTGRKLGKLLQMSDDFLFKDFCLVNGGREIAAVGSGFDDETYIETFPFLSTFEDVCAAAREQLHDREFNSALDLNHVN